MCDQIPDKIQRQNSIILNKIQMFKPKFSKQKSLLYEYY